jgi:hypothetical protein
VIEGGAHGRSSPPTPGQRANPADWRPVELVIARNPDPESRLPYLLRVPLGAGLVFSTVGTWPRSRALYCHPLGLEHWPDDAEVVERTGAAASWSKTRPRAGAARAPSAAPAGYTRPTPPAPTRSAPRVGRPLALLAQVVDERGQLRPTTQQQSGVTAGPAGFGNHDGGRQGERSGPRTRECLLQERVRASCGGRGGERRGDRCDSGDGRVVVIPGCSVSCAPEGTSATHVRSRLIARDGFGAVDYAP